MATTPIYLLPYPLPSDPVDVAEDIKKLSQQSETVFNTKAPLESPTFTGIPLLTNSPATSDNSKKIASTEYVKNQGYITSLSAASTYAPIISPGLTGTPTAPTAVVDTNTTQIATTAYVIGQGYAKLASPTFTGSPTAPTASASANDTKIATTAFVKKSMSLVDISYQTANYTLNITDAGKVVEIESSIDTNLTIPSDTTANFDIGTTIDVIRTGTGSVTLIPESSVTIQSADNALKINKQFSAISLYKRSSNVWIAIGDLIV